MSHTSPIGIFDSGIGGLTVFEALRRQMPKESLVYLGDTARLPYGTKSAETVARYALECAAFLSDMGVKAIVIACNTASAYALPDIAKKFDLPVMGVVEPGAKAAIASSRTKAIGVIGTTGTIASNAYGRTLKAMDPNVRVVSRACPLFVPLVEEGWLDNEVTVAVANRYLALMREEGIDTLILGCTHYPLISKVIQNVVGDMVTIVDSAGAVGSALSAMLSKEGLLSDAPQTVHRMYVTDIPRQFETIARRFLGDEMPTVTRVDL